MMDERERVMWELAERKRSERLKKECLPLNKTHEQQDNVGLSPSGDRKD